MCWQILLPWSAKQVDDCDTVDGFWFEVCQSVFPKILARAKPVTNEERIDEKSDTTGLGSVAHPRLSEQKTARWRSWRGLKCSMKAEDHNLQDDPEYLVFTRNDIWNNVSHIDKDLSKMHKAEGARVSRCHLVHGNQAIGDQWSHMQQGGMNISRIPPGFLRKNRWETSAPQDPQISWCHI